MVLTASLACVWALRLVQICCLVWHLLLAISPDKLAWLVFGHLCTANTPQGLGPPPQQPQCPSPALGKSKQARRGFAGKARNSTQEQVERAHFQAISYALLHASPIKAPIMAHPCTR